MRALKKDIQLGASQFSDLDKLIEKENEPKYILLKTHNLEQGYLAVTYLAAGFDKKTEEDSMRAIFSAVRTCSCRAVRRV